MKAQYVLMCLVAVAGVLLGTQLQITRASAAAPEITAISSSRELYWGVHRIVDSDHRTVCYTLGTGNGASITCLRN